ncbi:selenocysteine-specific translation elongation factor [Verrucomicrobiota bacterium]
MNAQHATPNVQRPSQKQTDSNVPVGGEAGKRLIMGTAGHVDHGKTALIKALTGIDCDTHKEEKARGITINLGFAHLELPSGLSLGIVDVPGHKDFVHTMVGGASGIDMTLMVVAADSGVMPQTLEHLQIIDVLGVKAGVVAVTRTDLADKDIVDVAEEEIRELVAGTSLDGCPIVRTSAVTGDGLDELRQRLDEAAQNAPQRPDGEVFRMFVDRIFTVSGFGTVVTGSVMSGTLRVEDTAYLLPGAGKELRVRRLEHHGEETEQVDAGERASINLVGLEREDFKRGMIVSDRVLRDTAMADVRLRVFEHGHEFRLWKQVLFHVGTFEGAAKIHLLDRDRAAPGDTVLAQIHLATPCVVQNGDGFVIRSSSSEITLGGGEIIDAAPLHHRRRPRKLIDDLARVAEGSPAEMIAAEVRKAFRALSHREIADNLNIPVDQAKQILEDDMPHGIVSYSSDGEMYLVVKTEHDRLAEQVLKKIAAFHRRNPLEERGRTAAELTGILGIGEGTSAEALLRVMLQNMSELKKVGRTWALKEHSAEIRPEMRKRIDLVEDFLGGCGMQTPLMSDLATLGSRHKMDDHEANQILRYLVSHGSAYFVEREYIHALVVDSCREKLLRALLEREEGMTVAEFRDLVGGNRKICLLLLAIYDKEGVTARKGDVRVLTEKGRGVLQKVAKVAKAGREQRGKPQRREPRE